MSMLYDETLLDLRDDGLLAISLERGSGSMLPLPAHLHAYARWIDPQGGEHDRLALCTREVDPASLESAANALRHRFAGAVPSVRGRLDHLAGLIAPGYRETPTRVVGFASGLVLLLFLGNVRTMTWRLVDIPGNRVVAEVDGDATAASWGVTSTRFMPNPIGHALVYASGREHVVLGLGLEGRLVEVSPAGLADVTPPEFRGRTQANTDMMCARFATRHLLIPLPDAPNVRIVSLDGGKTFDYISGKGGKASITPAGAADADRFALGHPGAVIEIVDLATRTPRYARMGAGGREGDRIEFSPNGRFVLVHDAKRYPGVWLLDIDEGRIAEGTLPDSMISINRERFDPTPRFVPGYALTDRGGWLLEGGALRHTPIDAFAWRPFELSSQARKPPQKAVKKTVETWLQTLHWPALALKPARKNVTARSRKYGPAMLPPNGAWPLHEDRPMLPLCQIDLAETAPLPLPPGLARTGWLQVFVAVDEERTAVLEDHAFNPCGCLVRWIDADAVEAKLPADAPDWPAEPVVFAVDASDLPSADSPRLAALGSDMAALDAYREQIERRLPEGASAGDRLGGYPHLVQNDDLEIQAEQIARGLSWDDAVPLAAAAQWRLLLQLDSDDSIMWGTDSGLLCLMIRADDLARGDFSGVVAITAGC